MVELPRRPAPPLDEEVAQQGLPERPASECVEEVARRPRGRPTCTSLRRRATATAASTTVTGKMPLKSVSVQDLDMRRINGTR